LAWKRKSFTHTRKGAPRQTAQQLADEQRLDIWSAGMSDILSPVKGDSQEDDEDERRHKNMRDLHRSDVAVLVLKPRSNKDTTGLLAKDHIT
jgi:hypothetical protein